ncbi:hypothetical protein M9H77_17575 [Catharanthus roseus]|uniref:Uncharacterized protein n=1 Tax=Catharanthus roseus TaxID=4058 RepID=A0ACC0B514_CATRO|nr:hypothetical protein M9H77_17575 [Catharanthus roseus]
MAAASPAEITLLPALLPPLSAASVASLVFVFTQQLRSCLEFVPQFLLQLPADSAADFFKLQVATAGCCFARVFNFRGCNSPGLIMSMEPQLPTHYNEGTSGSSHYNLDTMKVIMQELQLMRKDMKEMRGNITNDMSLLILNEDMVTSLLMQELLSIILIIAMTTVDLELEMNEVRNEGNYVNKDGRFHKRRGDYEEYYDSYSHEGYNGRTSSQTLGTTSRPLSFNNLKLPLLWGTFVLMIM